MAGGVMVKASFKLSDRYSQSDKAILPESDDDVLVQISEPFLGLYTPD
jgi:hypothetical protein